METDDTFDAIKTGSGIGESLDPSVVFYPDQYCPVVESMKLGCFESSLLELFAVKGRFTSESQRQIENLTQEKLIDMVNNVHIRQECCFKA